MSHYFTNDPAREPQPTELTVNLQGRSLTVTSDQGIFSQDRLDKGTKVLLNHVPEPPAQGVFVDVGCGWGPITLALAFASPDAKVFGVDVNDRARELTALNAASHQLTNVTVCAPDEFPDTPIDVLWSNPPIRIGKANAQKLLSHWLQKLAPTGAAYLVINKNLGSDSYHKWLVGLGYQVERRTSSGGFRVLEVRPPVSA